MLSVNSLPAGGELILLTAVQLETSGELGDIRCLFVFIKFEVFFPKLRTKFIERRNNLCRVSHLCDAKVRGQK